MFFKKDEQQCEVKSNLKGGTGDLHFRNVVPADMLYGAGTFVSVVTFEPGQSIGVHDHVSNFEIYYVLEGEATVTDNGEERILKPGDSEICANGNTHSIANKGSENLVIMAMLLNNFQK